MGLFGSEEKRDGQEDASVAEQARIESMPLPVLAEEILVRAWGRGGPGDAYEKSSTAISYYEIENLYRPDAGGGIFGASPVPTGIGELLEEALQMLEHARLVVFRVSGGDIVKVEYRPTRAGLKAIDAGNVRSLLDGSPG